MAEEYSFDCFLSHNSRDQPTARALAAILKARKLLAWIDREELAPGEPWLDGLAQGLHACRSVAVLIGASGTGLWEAEETRTALDLAVRRNLRVFAVLLPGAGDTREIPLFLSNRNWVDLRNGLEDADGLDRLVWGITGVRPGRSAADETPHPYQPRTSKNSGSAPGDPPTLTLILECIGDQLSVSTMHPQPVPPRISGLAKLRRSLDAQDCDTLFRTLFESPARLADLVTAAGGAPADEPKCHPLRLRLLCTDPRLATLPWHCLTHHGERLGDKPGWIIEVMDRAEGDPLTIALDNPLVVAPANPALSARPHVMLATAHLARLLAARRARVPWAKTARELDEALGEAPGLIYIFAPLNSDGRLILGKDAEHPEFYGLDRLVERLEQLRSQPPWTKPLVWLHLVEGEATVDLSELWTRLRPLTQLLLIQITNPRTLEPSQWSTLDLMKQMADGMAEPAAILSRLGNPSGTHLWLGGYSIRLRPGDADAWVIAYIRASLLRLVLGRVKEKRQVAGGIREALAGSLTFYGVCGDGQACVHDFPEQVRRYIQVYHHGITIETRPFPLTMRTTTRLRDEVVNQFNQDLSVTQVRSMRKALEEIPVVTPDIRDTVVIALSWLLEPAPDFPPTLLASWLAEWKQGLLEVLGQPQIPKPFRILLGACIQWTQDWPGGFEPRELQRRIDQTLEQTARKGYVTCIKMESPLDTLQADDLQVLYRDESLRDRLGVGDISIDEDNIDPINVLVGYLIDKANGRFQDTTEMIYNEYNCGYKGLKDALKVTKAEYYAKIALETAADSWTS